MSYISSEINPQQASRDLDTVRGALGHIARSSSGDGFYFFIWGAIIAVVMPLVGWLPGAVSYGLAIALYLGGWGATIAFNSRQKRDNLGSDWRGSVFWIVIAAESFLFTFLFIWGVPTGFQPGFLDIVNILLFALGLIIIGAFSDLRISLIGFAEIAIALILPALLPSGGDRLALSGLLLGGCYILAGWFTYQTGQTT
jgi:hypothetical protein